MKASGGDLRYVWVESHIARDSRKTNQKKWDKALQGGAPQVISWFIIPLTIVISTINHSYWSYKPTERYLGGTTNRMLLHSKHPKQLAMLEPSMLFTTRWTRWTESKSGTGSYCTWRGETPTVFPRSQIILLDLTGAYSYGHLSVLTGYKWDYTFYKWGYKYL